MVEMKVAIAMAQVEVVKASEHEILKRLGASKKDIKEINAQT